jgi:predicted dehydrogenase
MNIRPEDKEVGMENFYAAVGSAHTSGKLLAESVDQNLSSGNGLGAKYFQYGTVDRPVRIGVIGTGDEGGVLIGALNPQYAKVVAIADIRPYNVYRAFHGDKSSANARRVRPGLLKVYGWADESVARNEVAVYEDGYEQLLDDPNVEAVIIALPLHLHAPASIKAMRKGKHVLCEKLMAHSVHECKEMGRVADETDKLLAVGHQRHYSVLYENAVQLIKKNLIGPIHHIRAQWHRDNLPGNDSWQKPLPTDPVMAEQHAAAQKTLARAKQEFAGVMAAAKKKISDKKTLALLDKFDRELIELPKKIAALSNQLSALAGKPDATDSQRQQIAAQTTKLETRLVAVNKTYLRKLRLEPSVARRYNLSALSDQVEILSQKLRDAEIATRVKDYGYRDRNVGGRDVPALEELIRWRLWDRTGGGLMAELGSHQLDAAGIFISALRNDGKKAKPLSVTAVGGRHVFPHDRDIDDHVYCQFEYPSPEYDAKTAPEKKIVVSYSSINGNGFGGYGETVLGTKGSLILDREKEVLLLARPKYGKYEPTAVARRGEDECIFVDGKAGSPEARLAREALTLPLSRGYTEQIEHLCWAIRERERLAKDGKDPSALRVPLRCSPEVALADAVIALSANLAMARGAAGENPRIDFDDAWFDIESNKTPEGVAPDTKRAAYL